MKHYHKNPRKITRKQMDDLKRWLVEFGDLSGIVHNLPTDEIIGGNQRSEALAGVMSGLIQPVITERFDPPQEDGTVCLGYYDIDGRRYQYRGVNWDDAKAERANIIANKAGGAWDFDILANEFEIPVLLESGFDEWELGAGAVIGVDASDVGEKRETNNLSIIGKGANVGFNFGDIMVVIPRELYERMYAIVIQPEYHDRQSPVIEILEKGISHVENSNS